MARPRPKRAVVKRLRSEGCRKASDDGVHEKWVCPCGRHTAPVPRHREITAGVVRRIDELMACLPRGWLQ